MSTDVISDSPTDIVQNNEQSMKYSDNFRRMILQINPHSISCTYKVSFEQHSVTILANAESSYELFEPREDSQLNANDSFFIFVCLKS